MNVPELIEQAQSDGVTFRVTGDKVRINAPDGRLVRWLPILRQHRTEIRAWLTAGDLIAAAMRAPLDLSPGGEGVWDGRFLVARGPGGPPALRVQALGLKAAASLRRANPLAAREPAAVLAVLPGFHAGERLIAVPSLAFTVSGSGAFARFLKAEPLFFVSNTAA